MAGAGRDANALGSRRALGSRLRSLRLHILLWTILPAAIFLLGLSFTDVYGHQKAMRILVEERDRVLAQAVAGRIADRLQRDSDLLARLAAGEALPPPGQPLPPAVADAFPGGVVAVDGQGRAAALGEPSPPWQEAPFVSTLAEAVRRQRQPAWQAGGSGGLAPGYLAVATLLPGGDGALIGVLPLAGSAVAAAIEDLQVAPGARAWLLDAEGHPIYQAPGPQPPSGLAPLGLPAGEAVVTSSVPLPGTAWRLVLVEPWHPLVPLVLRYAQAPVAVAVVAVLLSLLAVLFGVRYVTRPLQRLGQQAQRMAWGDFQAVLHPVGGVEEIAGLQRVLRQMATQLQSYQAAMRSYVAAVTHAQEEERLRLARELHDDTVQSLIALGQQLERAHRSVLQNPATCQTQLDGLRQGVRDLVQDLRRLIADLRPLYLDDLGLVPALEMLVQASAGAGPPQLSVSGPVRRLAPELELALYRIVQAALKNVEQHARARLVRVGLSFEEQAVRVVVEDDGVGFAVPASPDGLASLGRFGLLGMRERAVRLGGWLAVTSQPGRGTRVEAYLPAPSPVPADRPAP